ncbi:hypothetical protein TBLA_0B02100 [Henningerozyma blattae CBS 6284]|uniref:DNA repair protein RAD7 n=1 Tax=Henningerozyma blattae (strain ATCC 34711 / CBS 6284 / DSM 70876 / NBRC 10599 / NRRL Y-10934 / UCD 77-7) TaxID=1071380 RepID=I2GY50_HENB6|nr:hypothetical protein TBLA_0B02100 [Tetrapisispora blattae CBS 6284]CCH59052.1 hypothetical protein TBLA_0B02100 [Tetrapisispora blattae CBS 6284]
MYRPGRRNRTNENDVKGPNSALTQFLKQEGINAETIRNNWLEHQKKKKEKEEEESNIEQQSSNNGSAPKNKVIVVKKEAGDGIEAEIQESSDSSATESDQDKADLSRFSRRLRSAQNDSDEEEYDSISLSTTTTSNLTKEVEKEEEEKNTKRKKQVLQARKKRRKKAANLLDRKTFIIPTLQSICISNISENILKLEKKNITENIPTVIGNSTNTDSSYNKDSPDTYSHLRQVFGGISVDNLNNLAKALSKNRALNDTTLQLFLKTNLTALEFHDCSKISYDGYKTLAIFSPYLKSLTLNMCGQLNNEALLFIMEKLPNLESLFLDGPFLINEPTWSKFFEGMKGRLKEFHISNTHRFTDKNLSSLLENCGPELISLGFSRMDSLFNYSLIPQYLTNQEFHTISLQYPYNEDDVNDETVINILSQIGKSLKSLNLNGCTAITDVSIINGFSAFLADNHILEELSIEELDQITDDSMVYLFSTTSFPKLKALSLQKCINLGNASIVELFLSEAKDSILDLNLNSLKQLTQESFTHMFLPELRHLNMSFVRSVNNDVVELIGKQNLNISLLEVFGDNLVTGDALIRDGLTIIGRQSDSI